MCKQPRLPRIEAVLAAIEMLDERTFEPSGRCRGKDAKRCALRLHQRRFVFGRTWVVPDPVGDVGARRWMTGLNGLDWNGHQFELRDRDCRAPNSRNRSRDQRPLERWFE